MIFRRLNPAGSAPLMEPHSSLFFIDPACPDVGAVEMAGEDGLNIPSRAGPKSGLHVQAALVVGTPAFAGMS